MQSDLGPGSTAHAYTKGFAKARGSTTQHGLLTDNLPMDLPPPNLHDIILHGHIMPTPAKSWIMQLRHGGSVQVRLALCPTWAVVWTEWRQWWNEWATYTHATGQTDVYH